MRHTYPVHTTHTFLLHQRLGRMASCGPPPIRAVATPAAVAAAAAAAAARAAATPGSAAIHAAATPSIEQDNASTSSHLVYFGDDFPRYSSSRSPHPRFNIDTHEGERRCNSRSEDVCYLSLLHEVAPAVSSAGRTRARTSCCLHRRDGKECRLYAHNGTKALIRHLHKASYYIVHPRGFARNASYKRRCFWRITTQTHPKKS